jgi:DNA-binding CsgD family transcriptional regulator
VADAVERYREAERLPSRGDGPNADLVEALIRDGQTAEADALVERDASAARCRALLAADEQYEPAFRDALALHPPHDAFGRARTQLCFGERLRRSGRRTDAREQLRAAHATFERLGARPWSERAATELRATGERLRRRHGEGEELTPQELQVALQVAEGKTNKEAGAALFLSPKTIDYHLRSVFRKLGVSSRAELARHFATRSDQAADQAFA